MAIGAAGVLLLGVNYALVFWSAQFIPSGLVAILQAGTPVIALAFGWLLGSERVTVRKTLALVTAIAGVIVIVGAEARASNAAALAFGARTASESPCVPVSRSLLRRSPHAANRYRQARTEQQHRPGFRNRRIVSAAADSAAAPGTTTGPAARARAREQGPLLEAASDPWMLPNSELLGPRHHC